MSENENLNDKNQTPLNNPSDNEIESSQRLTRFQTKERNSELLPFNRLSEIRKENRQRLHNTQRNHDNITFSFKIQDKIARDDLAIASTSGTNQLNISSSSNSETALNTGTKITPKIIKFLRPFS